MSFALSLRILLQELVIFSETLRFLPSVAYHRRQDLTIFASEARYFRLDLVIFALIASFSQLRVP